MNEQGGRIVGGDRLQFARDLFGRHAGGIYQYVLAWTGQQASAVDLTTMVLRTAVARMDQLREDADAAELEMRLVALARAAVTRWRARVPADSRVATEVPEQSMPLFEGLGELDDNQREILILCELLGQEPEHAGRLLGCDRPVLEELRVQASESLWRALNGAPAEQPVSTWERLTVCTALRRAAAGWLPPADEAVLAYLEEQLFGEAPVGVPAEAPARGAAAAKPPAQPKAPAPVAAKAKAPTARPKVKAPPAPVAAKPALAAKPAPAVVSPAAAAKAAAKPAPAVVSPAAAAARPEAKRRAGLKQRVAGLKQRVAGLEQRVAALVLPLRGRWAALGIAAAAAAGLGVVTALTLGSPVSGSSECGGGLPCLVATTVGGPAGDGGAVAPAPTDASGDSRPTSSGGTGLLGPGPGFRPITTTSVTTTGLPPTTARGPGTTARPPRTTRPGPTSPPTTSPPTTSPPTTGPATTTPTTTGTTLPPPLP
jgi:DNA-directed RNA polymerase specialized sigma24 family protein